MVQLLYTKYTTTEVNAWYPQTVYRYTTSFSLEKLTRSEDIASEGRKVPPPYSGKSHIRCVHSSRDCLQLTTKKLRAPRGGVSRGWRGG